MRQKEVSDEQQVLEIKYLGGTGVWNCKAELIPDGQRYNHKNKTKLHAVVLQHTGKKHFVNAKTMHNFMSNIW